MTVDIKCETCDELLGQITKEEVTQEDIDLYLATTVCSNGHGNIQLVEVIPDDL